MTAALIAIYAFVSLALIATAARYHRPTFRTILYAVFWPLLCWASFLSYRKGAANGKARRRHVG